MYTLIVINSLFCKEPLGSLTPVALLGANRSEWRNWSRKLANQLIYVDCCTVLESGSGHIEVKAERGFEQRVRRTVARFATAHMLSFRYIDYDFLSGPWSDWLIIERPISYAELSKWPLNSPSKPVYLKRVTGD